YVVVLAAKRKGLVPGFRRVALAAPPLEHARFSPLLLPILWMLVLLSLYAVRLPVVFHHGRYLMPLIPWLVVLGILGLRAGLRALPMRLLAKVYAAATVVFWLAMWANGAVVYSWDTRFITDEQVTVARWIQTNTPPSAAIATHD